MIIDLTTVVLPDSPLIAWAESQDNPHVAMGHVGTHLDTYQKSHIPLEYFRSEGVFFDVKGREEIGIQDIDIDAVKEDSFVLFRTGRIEEYEYGTQGYFENHPQLSHELIESLIKRKIRFIGIDAAGIRRGTEHEEADRLCENNGIYVIENLKNLKEVDMPFVVYTMWLDDLKMTGLKCRVIAEILK